MRPLVVLSHPPTLLFYITVLQWPNGSLQQLLKLLFMDRSVLISIEMRLHVFQKLSTGLNTICSAVQYFTKVQTKPVIWSAGTNHVLPYISAFSFCQWPLWNFLLWKKLYKVPIQAFRSANNTTTLSSCSMVSIVPVALYRRSNEGLLYSYRFWTPQFTI